jgi:DIM1 family U5 snRNP protein
MYELYDPVTLMFFFRNKHMIDIIETIYRGAKKGRGLVVSPKGGSNVCLGVA